MSLGHWNRFGNRPSRFNSGRLRVLSRSPLLSLHFSHSFQPKTPSSSSLSQLLPLFSNSNLTSLHPLHPFLHQSLKSIHSLPPFLTPSSNFFPFSPSLATSTLLPLEGVRSLSRFHISLGIMGHRKSTAHKPAKTSARKPARNPSNDPPLSLYLSEGLLSEDKYEVFWKLVDQQGIWSLLFMKERYYPRMMRVVATSLWLADKLNGVGGGEFYLRFWIGGVTYTITLEELASLWGLPNDGIRFKGGHLRPKEYDHWGGKYSQSVLNMSYIGGGKYSVGEMSTDHCLSHY
ncbi:hypothetical protein PIB30_037986 [Stylosanthes scabra]|uniref:Uncharacterized protein n=1 Tax=Stylosanthes scabra TaxID=79078 RepID=A0ABU6YCJ4_9FABA|nr:hypothetical protein [Stylosanthes scabra]